MAIDLFSTYMYFGILVQSCTLQQAYTQFGTTFKQTQTFRVVHPVHVQSRSLPMTFQTLTSEPEIAFKNYFCFKSLNANKWFDTTSILEHFSFFTLIKTYGVISVVRFEYF